MDGPRTRGASNVRFEKKLNRRRTRASLFRSVIWTVSITQRRKENMNRKVMGLLVRVGVGIGTVTSLIVLFLRGEKPRRFLRERFKKLRRTLPKPAQVQHDA